MPSNHSLIVAAICALPLSLVACGGSSSDTIVPTGAHHQYVVSNAFVPTTDAQVRQYGLDLGAKLSSKPDGIVDNALGQALLALTMLNFDIQGTISTAVDQGNIILLVDVQTADFNSSGAAGLTVKIGSNPTPPACSGPADTTCRHHLSGTGSFQIAADSPPDALVTGKIASGTFNGGPGDITLQIAIGSPTPIKLNLLHARAQASSISDTGIMTAIIGGLVTQDELTTQIGPAIAASVSAILTRDCTPRGAPPDCGCKNPSTGLTVVRALDGDLAMTGGPAADCQVSADEVLGFALVKQLLLPESCSMDTCKAADSLSIGIKVQAVKATFPM
jgi:hypothetical protein